jgi:hypothetical protein
LPLGQKSPVSITAAVRIQVSESAHLGDLKTYLEAAECAVHVLDSHVLEVSVPRAPSEAQAVREMTLYLDAGVR